MFRVSPGTVLRRVAAVSLLALSTSLVACGEDQTDASAPGEVVATSTSPSAAPKNSDPNQGNPAADSISPEDAAKVSETPESKATIQAASEADLDKGALKQQLSEAEAALEQAGKKPKVTAPIRDREGSIRVDSTAIFFYDNEREAATRAQQFEQFLALNPGTGRVARTDNRVYVLSTKKKVKGADKTEFAALRDIVEGGV